MGVLALTNYVGTAFEYSPRATVAKQIRWKCQT